MIPLVVARASVAVNYLRDSDEPFKIPRGNLEVKDAQIDRQDAKTIVLDAKTKNVEAIAKFAQTKRVHLFGKLDQKIIDALRSLPQLSELVLHGIREIDGELNLKHLGFVGIDRSSGVNDLQFLNGCKKLQSLGLEACLKLNSLVGIEKLKSLREFRIVGAPVSSGEVDSLAPLQTLTKLEYLSLFTKVRDRSLGPITYLRNLQEFETANRFKQEEYRNILDACKKLMQIQLHNGTFDRRSGFIKDRD